MLKIQDLVFKPDIKKENKIDLDTVRSALTIGLFLVGCTVPNASEVLDIQDTELYFAVHGPVSGSSNQIKCKPLYWLIYECFSICLLSQVMAKKWIPLSTLNCTSSS